MPLPPRARPRCLLSGPNTTTVGKFARKIIHGYEHSAADHFSFGTYFYYRGKGQLRGGSGLGTPPPPGSTRSVEEASIIPPWARAAEKEDSVAKALFHFRKAYEITQGEKGEVRSGLKVEEWRCVEELEDFPIFATESPFCCGMRLSLSETLSTSLCSCSPPSPAPPRALPPLSHQNTPILFLSSGIIECFTICGDTARDFPMARRRGWDE